MPSRLVQLVGDDVRQNVEQQRHQARQQLRRPSRRQFETGWIHTIHGQVSD
jgi:hypothetical protein